METLYARHLQLRNHSLALTSTLTAEDQCVHARLPYLFNSYYEALGPCHLRQVAPFQIAHRLVN